MFIKADFMKNVEQNIRGILANYLSSDLDVTTKMIMEKVEEGLSEQYKPILEIRIPSWSGIQRHEYDKFLKRVEAACGKNYKIFVLPMRYNAVQVSLNPNIDVEKFRQEWKKVMSGHSGQIQMSDSTLVTDVGTVQVHSLFSTDDEKYLEIKLRLRSELDELLKKIN